MSCMLCEPPQLFLGIHRTKSPACSMVIITLHFVIWPGWSAVIKDEVPVLPVYSKLLRNKNWNLMSHTRPTPRIFISIGVKRTQSTKKPWIHYAVHLPWTLSRRSCTRQRDIVALFPSKKHWIHYASDLSHWWLGGVGGCPKYFVA